MLETEQGTACLPWQTMHVHGLDLLSEGRRNAVLAAVPTGCITARGLGELSRLITEMFLQEGYFRIDLDPSQTDRQLTWTVRPAKVTAIRNSTALSSGNLFPGVIGKPVNVRDLDEGLEQANRLAGHHMTMDVYPDEQGNVAIALTDEAHGPVHGSIGWNDFGQDSTGRAQVDAQLSVDNPLGLSDSLGLNAASTIHTDPSHYSRNAGFFYGIPYGYWTFSALGGASVYRTQTQLIYNTVRQDGDSWFAGLRADYVFSRDAAHISSAYGQLMRSAVKSRFMGTTLDIQSPSLATFSIGLNHTALFGGNVLGANVEYKQGLHWLGADQDSPESDLPAAQFKKLAASLSWSHAYRLGARTIRFDHVLVGQYSADSLPSLEQIGITDRSAVRGFRDIYLTGDYGYYLRQTVTSPWPVGDSVISPYLGLDAGRTRQHGGQWQSAVSGTVGITFDKKPWSANIALSRGKAFAQGNGGDAWDTECMAQLRAFF